MTTVGQFNSKNPTIKRILKEASELTTNPTPDYYATPLEDNIFEWHFTLRGPPSTPYTSGLYHGRIVLPPTYPLRPPSFRFLTPSGRFETNREICLSISGHHEETWQPAWGIRTALVALRAFMEGEAKGQVGGLECDEGSRKRLAGESVGWMCSTCGKSNQKIMNEVETSDMGGKESEKVPEELRMVFRDDLGPTKSSTSRQTAPTLVGSQQQSSSTTTRQRRRLVEQSQDAWMDKAIYAIGALLIYLIARKLLSFLW